MKIPFLPLYILSKGQIADLQKKIKNGLIGVGGIGFIAGVIFGRLTGAEKEEGEA